MSELLAAEEQARTAHRAAFKSLSRPPSLTFCVSAKTKVVVKGGGDLTLGPDGDRGIVKVRYAKEFDPTDSAQLADFQATAVAKQIIDKKPVPSS